MGRLGGQEGELVAVMQLPSENCVTEHTAFVAGRLAHHLPPEFVAAVVVTGDLAATFGNHAENPDTGSLEGATGCLTTPTSDGILVAVHVDLLPPSDPAVLDFLLLHEAQHVMRLATGEDVTRSFQRRNLSLQTVEGFWTRLAGSVIDEFRAERGALLHADVAAAEGTRLRYQHAVTRLTEAESPTDYSREIPAMFKACGYMAGALRAVNDIVLPATSEDTWLIDWIHELADILVDLPAPNEELTSEQADHLLDAAATHLAHGLAQHGLQLVLEGERLLLTPA